jgi:hypothetical protein
VPAHVRQVARSAIPKSERARKLANHGLQPTAAWRIMRPPRLKPRR